MAALLRHLAICVFVILPALSVEAQSSHRLIRRVVVFPVQVHSSVASQPALQKAVEDVWWQVRERLTGSQRFLVASQQFLIKSDVYLARGELEPADAVILGRLLDAHALMTLQLEGRELRMQVTDGDNGSVLWQKAITLHPSLTVSDQLARSAAKLVDDFIASVPYQAYTVVDALIGKAVYDEGDLRLARIDVGTNSQVQVGDLVQWIRLQTTNVAPLFQGGGLVSVYAEGKVIKIENTIAVVQVQRANKNEQVKEFSLVRIPREFERLQSEFLIRNQVGAKLSVELAAPERDPMQEIKRERRPLATTLSWISSFAALLLLAF